MNDAELLEIFFLEMEENIEQLEEGLLNLEQDPSSQETLHSIFRAAHTIKGSAGIVGFSNIQNFTHSVEDLLDALRSHEISLTSELFSLLFQATDLLKAMLKNIRQNAPEDLNLDWQTLVEQLKAYRYSPPISSSFYSETFHSIENIDDAKERVPSEEYVDEFLWPKEKLPLFFISLTFDADLFSSGIDPLIFIEDLNEIGLILAINIDTKELPSLESFNPEKLYLRWEILIETSAPLEEIDDIFLFVKEDSEISIIPIDPKIPSSSEGLFIGETPVYSFFDNVDSSMTSELSPLTITPTSSSNLIGASTEEKNTEEEKSSEDHQEILDQQQKRAEEENAPQELSEEKEQGKDLRETQEEDLEKAREPNFSKKIAPIEERGQPSSSSKTAQSSSKEEHKEQEETELGKKAERTYIRVTAEKLDHLLNSVSDLVIAQTELKDFARNFSGSSREDLLNLVEKLEKSSVAIQQDILSLRMVSLAPTFIQFRRFVRDVAARLGKEVELDISGYDTEIDRNLIALINDPLKHLILNALVHGIEFPEERRAIGKDPIGRIHLRGSYESGHVVIEVRDDGRGINREKLLLKAQKRGKIGELEKLTEQQILELIFLPGLSTVQKTTELAGRGVGMDVVRENIKKLQGQIVVQSKEGEGTSIRLFLPLTLAILNGMLVRLGSELFIIPIAVIQEAIRPHPEDIKTIKNKGEVIYVRGRYLPLVRLHRFFNIQDAKENPAEAIVLIIRDSGELFALLVDMILDEQQLIIKSLSENYRDIDGLSGATILGDGSIALICDVHKIINLICRENDHV